MTKLADLAPLPAEDWDACLHDVREQLGHPPNVHATLANHPALLAAWMVFRNHMVHGLTLERRDAEILILRTAHRLGSRYEWVSHSRIALDYGLSAAQIESLAEDPPSGDWSERDRLLLAAADECAAAHRISPETRDALFQHFEPRQILDLLFTIGMYTTLGYAIETLEVPLDESTAGFAAEKLR